jgi:hypothetical protein
MPKRAFPSRLRTALAWLAVALQMAVLYWPQTPDAVQLGIPHIDKLAHAAVFAAAVWVWTAPIGDLWTSAPQAVPVRPWWVPPARRPWLVAALFAENAALSEVAQLALLPERSGDVWDVVADLVGIGVGLWLAFTSRRRFAVW